MTILFLCFFAYSNTVKVGYYIDSGNFMSGFSEEDPKSGYAYEYLQTISSYTGWDYEYVYGYFDDLYAKLLKGEIDILPDVSYCKTRENEILYPEYAMGTESYYLYANQKKNYIDINDLSKISNMKLALLKGSYQYNLCKNWLKKRGLTPEIHEFTYDTDIERDFNNHIYDLYLTIDTVADHSWEPVAKIGESEFYIAVNKNRHDLLDELNYALNEIYMTNPYYNSILWAKYFVGPPLSKRLSKQSEEWFFFNKRITVGSLNNSLPVSNFNKTTQRAEGLVNYLMDYLNFIYDDELFSIDYKFFNSYKDLMTALAENDVDLAFPAIQDLNAAEKDNIHLSFTVMTIPMSYVFSTKTADSFMKKVAVTEKSQALQFMEKHYPSIPIKTFPTTEACLKAVMKKEVSGAVFNTYMANNMVLGNRRYKDLRIMTLPETASPCFAVNRENSALISLLNRVIASIPAAEINHVTSQFSIKTDKHTLKDFFTNYAEIIFFSLLIFLIVLIALIASLDKLAELINYDTLTHLLNRRRLTAYMNTAMEKAAFRNEPFALLLFDLDNFKKVNDTYGHECGDEILKMAAATISKGVKRHDFVFRWGGEEILVLLKSTHEIAQKVAERIRKDIEFQTVEYKNTEVCITATVGIAPYIPGCTAESLFTTADENLYKGKQNGKNQVVG